MLSRRVTATVAATSVLLGSSSSGEMPVVPSPEGHSTISSRVVHIFRPAECFTLRGILLDKKTAKERATACSKVQKTGRVALVGYGIKPEVLARVAGDSEKVISTATNHIVTLGVVAIQASAEATTAFDKASPSCVNTDKYTDYASRAANLAMPELDEYDFVVALTKKPSCNKAVKGRADNARFADILSLIHI